MDLQLQTTPEACQKHFTFISNFNSLIKSPLVLAFGRCTSWQLNAESQDFLKYSEIVHIPAVKK